MTPADISHSECAGLHNADNSACIESIMVIGERCSGTNWLTQLCANNFQVSMHNDQGGGTFGWKHNPKGLDNEGLIREEGGHTLFIFITRSLCDWIEHFFNKPWHVPREFVETREKFLTREPWVCRQTTDGTGDDILDNDMQTGERFRNLLDLRARKHKHWLDLCEKESATDALYLPHTEWVRYEDLLDNPAVFLRHLQTKYSLKRTARMWKTLKTRYKGLYRQRFNSERTKTDAFYFNCAHSARKWTESVLHYVQKNADWTTEANLGYEAFTEEFLRLNNSAIEMLKTKGETPQFLAQSIFSIE